MSFSKGNNHEFFDALYDEGPNLTKFKREKSVVFHNFIYLQLIVSIKKHKVVKFKICVFFPFTILLDTLVDNIRLLSNY